ncbi:MAG: alpha/beta fold hydrolase [Patescibacteria group bacterium]|mgnify:FL=1
MNNKFLSFIKFLIGWPISIVAIFFIVRIIFSQFNLVTPYIKTPTLFPFIAGVVCFILFYFGRAFVWKKLLEERGHNIEFKEVSFLWGLSELKRFVPGNIWSFLGRAFSFSKKGVDNKTVISLIFAEIGLFVIASLLLSLFSIQFILPYVFSIHTYSIFVIPLITFSTFLTALIFIFNKNYFNKSRLKFLKNFLPNFNPYTNFVLLSITVVSLFFFGLGTFLTIASVVYLPVNFILPLIGFFVLSLFIGFLSFVTPMGLGVREGIISIGLSQILTLQAAGFAAIFARIVLILSEIIFILLATFWKNIKGGKFLKIENYIKNHLHEIILLLMIAAYIMYFLGASFLRYDNFFTGRFDLGNMDQAVWNTIHGRIFKITDPNGTDIISRLSFHADFLLILISPLYLIWSHPKMLLLLQSVVLGSGALFVYLISKNVLKNKNISLAFSLAYLLNPSLQFANLYDFHPVTLATAFLLGAFYFLIKKRHLWLSIFLILAALTKEQVWVIASLFGIYLFFVDKKRFLGILLTVFSLSVFYYLIAKAIPMARGAQHFALSYYSDFGESPLVIIRNIFLSPGKIIETLLHKEQLIYLIRIFSPLGFLSLFYPMILVFTLPDFFINLLSNNSQLREIYYQYTAAITPFIFISAIYGVSILRKRFSQLPLKFFTWYLLIAAILGAYYIGPLPGSKNPGISMFTRQLAERKIISEFLEGIPPQFSIASTNNLGSHLSRRQKIYTIPVGIDKADMIVFLLNDPFAQPSLKTQIEIAKKMKKDKNYIQVFKQGDFIVFEKRNLYLEGDEKRIKQVKLFPLSIPSLAHRDYEKGEIRIEKKAEANKSFTSYIASYSSDGLKTYTLLNIPNTPKPANGFPVVIVNHGYINPAGYDTVSSYKSIADYFSQKGYLVLKPDYRGNGKSEIDNKALMRFAYPIDVMNLISSIPSIKEANSNSVYLWGHSMGAEVTLKVIEIIGKNDEFSKSVKAAVLWAPVTDPLRWFSRQNLPRLEESVITPFPYSKTFQILGKPEDNPKLWESISPLSYLGDITIPIQIVHGTNDEIVPYQWGIELFNDLKSLSKNTRLNLYDNAGHNLNPKRGEVLDDSLMFFKSF